MYLKNVGTEVVNQKTYDRIFYDQNYFKETYKFDLNYKDVNGPVIYKEYHKDSIRLMCKHNKDLIPAIENPTIDPDTEGEKIDKHKTRTDKPGGEQRPLNPAELEGLMPRPKKPGLWNKFKHK